MNVNLKLKNMELWIADFNKNKPETTAQILQLKFKGEFLYGYDSFTLT
jgi:hypothetical protein